MMTRQDALRVTILSLINRKSEGTYWDFKRKHHEQSVELMHDILCLANTKHVGNRFLIYGVDDENYSLHPVDKDPGRKTQADLAGLFRDNASKFFQERFPDFYLEEIMIDGKLLDVVVIEDTPHKPYYLVRTYKGRLPAHHVYTRVGDTNTPVNGAAQSYEIERMWREHFGLDMPPLERIKRYLNEPDAWSLLIRDDGCDGDSYHSTFPEFTIRVSEAEDFIARHEEWTRGEIRRDNNHAGYYELYYHQTRLTRVRYVSFDDHKKSMVAPDWEPCGMGRSGSGRFYFYRGDSINYAVQKFCSVSRRRDDSLTLSVGGEGRASDEARSRWGHYLQIAVLRQGEFAGFLGSRPHSKRELLAPSRDESEQYQLFLQNLLDFDDWRNDLQYS